jgi:hypothetical protein
MRWIDLSAYGPARLRVLRRDPEPPAMFVMDGGDAVADALRNSGFRRTLSGLWFRTFEPSDAPVILRRLASDLPDAAETDAGPADVIQGYVEPAPAAVDGTEVEVDGGSVEEVLPAQAPTTAAGDPAERRVEGEDVDVACFGEVMDALARLASRIAAESRGRSETPAAPACDGGSAATEDVATAGETAIPVGMADGEEPPSDPARSGPDAPAAEAVLTFDFAWAVTAGAADIRHLTGLDRIADRNHVVAKLAFGEDGAYAARRIGALARGADGEGTTMRIVAVVRGADGSGFGACGDHLVVGDPGDGVGALAEAAAPGDPAEAAA